MKILVTGASGFIGSKLLDTLTASGNEHTVFAVVRVKPKNNIKNVVWVEADLSLQSWTNHLPDEKIDIVIHLAQSENYRNFPEKACEIMNVNVKATIELADWALRHEVKRFLFSSTGSVYGTTREKCKEEDFCRPTGMYASSKFSAELLLKPFSDHMSVIILRLFCVYGPGQKNAMLPNVMRSFCDGNEITLAGAVGVKFNPIYVDDCANVMNHFIMADVLSEYEIINVGGNEVVDLKQVVDFMREKTVTEGVVKLLDYEPTYAVGAVEKLNNIFNVSNPCLFFDGLNRVFESNFSEV